jgi:hypothetical protein
MIELVFVACLSAAPAQCQERHLSYSDVSLMGCMMGAQSALAEWKASQPDWRIAKWSCQMAGARGQSI